VRTDALVTLLARDAGAVEQKVWVDRYVLALSLGTLGSFLLMVATMGLRADLSQAVALPMFWFKFGFAAVLAGASLVVAMRLSRPGVRLGLAPATLALPLVGMWSAAAAALLAADAERATALLFGKTWVVCPFLIAMLSAPVFAAVVWAMRGLAPTNFRLAGAAVGLLAGSTGALVYCLHCPEMDAPFLGVWYVLGMLIPAGLGAVFGPRLLRW
jgi:hypothetical protein